MTYDSHLSYKNTCVCRKNAIQDESRVFAHSNVSIVLYTAVPLKFIVEKRLLSSGNIKFGAKNRGLELTEKKLKHLSPTIERF